MSCGLEIKENRSYADNRMSFIIVQRISCHGKRGGVHRGEYLSVFTRNPRGSKAKAIDEADVAAFLSYSKEHGIERILAHAPYTLNPCSKDAHTREFAWMTMADDLKRMEYTPGNCYNFHPGSHTGQGRKRESV